MKKFLIKPQNMISKSYSKIYIIKNEFLKSRKLRKLKVIYEFNSQCFMNILSQILYKIGAAFTLSQEIYEAQKV